MRRCPRESEGIFFMGYVQGEGRTQATLFPVTLEELIPDDHVCRVIDTFVDRLDMAGLGFERAEAAETGRAGYDPRDLLKLYLYGYLQQIRSSRRLELECRRNIELMWLLGRLAPDHKTIAEFRRMHREGVTAAGAELVRLARSVGLVKGEWVAIDGSKFQAVSSVKSVHEREALERYLEQLAEAAQAATGGPAQPINVVADAGYSNGEQAEACEAKGILPHVPANRGVNSRGDGTLFDRTEFTYQPESDTFLCPAGQTLARKQLMRKDRAVLYAAQPEVCGACPLKSRCTVSPRRIVTRHLHEEALQRMQQRATPEAMRLRRATVEHPFASLKYRIFGHPRFLLRGLRGAQTEISLAVAAYNLKRMLNILGGRKLHVAMQGT